MPRLTRRRFCAGSALAGVSLASVLPTGCDPGSAGPAARSLPGFQSAVGTTFTLRETDRSDQLTLTGVRVHAPPIRHPQPRGESFTLVFEGAGPALAQGIRRVSHPAFGDFALFLVPRGLPDPAGPFTYAASYCRL